MPALAISGIGTSPELTEAFQVANQSQSIRFLKVSIQNESLVPDGTIPATGSFEDDLETLQTELSDVKPAYVLARLGSTSNEWLAITYVPMDATIRDKMIYASTRSALTKSLGASLFTDAIFATAKADLTPTAYAAHKAHAAAPHPLSARERELEELKATERNTSSGAYTSSQERRSHVGRVGLTWSEDAERAVKDLAENSGSNLVVLSIDTTTETLILLSSKQCTALEVSKSLPTSDPCYAFFSWEHSFTSPPRRDIVSIYSCPTDSPVRHRMLYSSGIAFTTSAAKEFLGAAASFLVARRIETSDPTEIDEAFLQATLGYTNDGGAGASVVNDEVKQPFSRPKGPGRKR